MTIALFKDATVAVEWTITIEGKNEFGDTFRKEVRIDKSWERLVEGEIGFSINDGKKILAALQSAVVAHEAETFCPYVSGPERSRNLTVGSDDRGSLIAAAAQHLAAD